MSAFRFIFLTAILALSVRTLTLDEDDLKSRGTELLDREECPSDNKCPGGVSPPDVPAPKIVSISGWNNSAWSAQLFFAAQDPQL